MAHTYRTAYCNMTEDSDLHKADQIMAGLPHQLTLFNEQERH
jgi:hypothetical protein